MSETPNDPEAAPEPTEKLETTDAAQQDERDGDSEPPAQSEQAEAEGADGGTSPDHDDSEGEESPLELEAGPERTLESVIGLETTCNRLDGFVRSHDDQSVAPEYRELSTLIYGASGTGKRRLARAIAGELSTRGYRYDYIHSLHDPDRAAADGMEDLLEAARARAPVVIVLDCFGEVYHSDAARVFQRKLQQFRREDADVAVVGIIDKDSVLFGEVRPYFSSFDTVVKVEELDRHRREKLLRNALERADEDGALGFQSEAVDLEQIAIEADGFGVEALQKVARRLAARTDSDEPVSTEDVLEVVTEIDEHRAETIENERMLEDVGLPDVGFEDVGGLDRAKETLVERVQKTVDWSDTLDTLDVDIGSGVLLYGPPGNGKTMLVRALANELDHTFITVKGPELKSPLHGQTEANLRRVFEKARRNAPTIVFFDEFDSIGSERAGSGANEDIVNTLLTELDGLEGLENVFVVAATNRPESLDEALLRPGRFDHHVEVPAPDVAAQKSIFRKQTADLQLAADVTGEWFVRHVDVSSGAEIAAVRDRAVIVALRETETASADLTITRGHLQTAYEEFAAERTDQSRGTDPTYH